MRGELETEQNCNILTPNSSGYSSISFPFSWAAQPRAWGPSLCWDMVLIPASSLQLIWTSCRRSYIIIWRHIHTQFNPSTVKVIPRYLWPDASVIYTGAFLIWQPGRVGGQYATITYTTSAKASGSAEFSFTLSYLPNPSARAGYDTRSIF